MKWSDYLRIMKGPRETRLAKSLSNFVLFLFEYTSESQVGRQKGRLK